MKCNSLIACLAEKGLHSKIIFKKVEEALMKQKKQFI